MKGFCANCHKSVEVVCENMPVGFGEYEEIYYCPDCGYSKGQFYPCEHCSTLISGSAIEIVHDFDGSSIGSVCPSCGEYTDDTEE